MDPLNTPAAPPPEPSPAAPAPEQQQPVQQPQPVAPPAEPAPEPAPAPDGDAKPEGQQGLTSILAPEEPKPEGEAVGKTEPAGDDEPFAVAIPDGFVADKEAVGFLEGMVKDGKYSKEQAQELADQHMKGIQRYQAHLISLAQQQVTAWQDEIRNHPKYGGVNLDRSVEAAKLVLQKYATPKMRTDFQNNGMLDHPDFFSMLMKIHEQTSEGVSIGGAGQAMPERDPAKTMFPGFE